ncbi:MAG: CRISPR-associated protein [Leptolyngbyaceae cyanobacterium RM1_1_2]|nr:CRISPR-associated protein [Leptolyngbyaceae cyanobacterium RM1_1_2]
MAASVYTAITFAPVQGFIEKSRKLRDLYGSSFILSYLSERVCNAARHSLMPHTAIAEIRWPEDPIVSPALISVTQGIPNQILIRGEFPQEQAVQAFKLAWRDIVLTCQNWIQANVPNRSNAQPWEYGCWNRSWQAWIEHAWEFFWATGIGETGDNAKVALNECKFARAWTGVNWTGESSSLSGIDGRAWPHMGKHRPYSRSQAAEDAEVREFYQQLMEKLGEASITTREFLSIPELVKRLVTYEQVVNYGDATQPKRLKFEIPPSFRDLNRLLNRSASNLGQPGDLDESNKLDEALEEANREEAKRWTGWFQGDGDRAGDFLLAQPDDVLHRFSQNMRNWGANLKTHLPPITLGNKLSKKSGRIIYAGGDDFLGVLYRNPPLPPLTPIECIQDFFGRFKSQIWSETQEPITVSVGFVWVAPSVPQRDVLQHCREAEQSAKRAGRDRIACRILFNDGKHLEWTCPWWLLEGNAADELGPDTLPATGILGAYRDRQGQSYPHSPNWTHLYSDVTTLEARHGFGGGSDVARGLIQIYFGQQYAQLLANPALWWNQYQDPEGKTDPRLTGILGDREAFSGSPDDAFNTWVISLAKVGFHLSQTARPMSSVEAA